MKRITFAVVAMLAVSALAAELLGFFAFPGSEHWQLQSCIVGFGAAGAGGFIARARFVPIALLVHAAISLAILYILHSIANGQVTYRGLVGYNALAMAIGFSTVALGAYVGQRLSHRGPRAPAAA
jgi:hypothetical protein